MNWLKNPPQGTDLLVTWQSQKIKLAPIKFFKTDKKHCNKHYYFSEAKAYLFPFNDLGTMTC